MKNPCLIFLALAVTIIPGACKKSNSSGPSPIKNNLVYIYSVDSTDGVSFKSLLQDNGCTVTLLDRSKAGAFNYSDYGLIIIGNSTDTNNSPHGWIPADAMTIKNTGKPLLLMGQGGSLFANDIQDTVNWENSAGNDLTGFKAMDRTSVLYTRPKTITVGADSVLTLYSSACKVVSFYAGSMPVPNTIMIGMETNYNRYFPVSITDTRFGSFGFYANADAMTSTGKDFFVNLVYYVGGFTP